MCRKSCGQCSDSIESIDKESSACLDLHQSCPIAANRGLCSQAEIVTKCPSSCGKCSLTTHVSLCVDKYPQCASMGSSKMCNQPSIQEACPKTCMKCPGSVIKAIGSCVDESYACAMYMKISSLKACNQPQLSQGCKKSCGLCGNEGNDNQLSNNLKAFSHKIIFL